MLASAQTDSRLRNEWDTHANSGPPPERFSTGNHSKAHWRWTEHGHAWNSRIGHRANGVGCPVCCGHVVVGGFNDLASKNPQLAAEWDVEANGGLTAQQVTAASPRNFYWRCQKFGHKWRASIGRQTRGCPTCSGRYVLLGFNDLASQNPALAAEWNLEGNGERRPTTVMPGSSYRAQWLCGRCGHRWGAAISERKKGGGCPAYSGRALQPGSNDLATRRPELVAEWDAARNAPLSPAQVTNDSGMKVWWLCAARGHSWYGPINTRTAGSCGICFGTRVVAGLNDLESQRPDLLREWDYNANGANTPDRVFVNGSARRHWKCAKHGHRWITTVTMRNAGSGCPYCSSHRVLAGFNDFASVRPLLVKEWDQAANGDLKPTQITARSNKRIWWKCVAGHQWQSTPSNRSIGTGCTRCIGAQTSLIEMSFFDAFQEQLDDLRNGARVLVKKRGKLRSMSIDILGASHSQRFVIEYDGEYYHRGKLDHDAAKTMACLDANYAVVRIRAQPLPLVLLRHPRLLQVGFTYPRTRSGSALESLLAPVVEEVAKWLTQLPA